jgi:hypothetical protein
MTGTKPSSIWKGSSATSKCTSRTAVAQQEGGSTRVPTQPPTPTKETSYGNTLLPLQQQRLPRTKWPPTYVTARKQKNIQTAAQLKTLTNSVAKLTVALANKENQKPNNSGGGSNGTKKPWKKSRCMGSYCWSHGYHPTGDNHIHQHHGRQGLLTTGALGHCVAEDVRALLVKQNPRSDMSRGRTTPIKKKRKVKQ